MQPVTSGAAMDVPELRLKSPSPDIHALRIPAPGAYTSTAAPWFENPLISSELPHELCVESGSHPVLPTVMAAGSAAGDVPVDNKTRRHTNCPYTH
jgi:hypothetical protein